MLQQCWPLTTNRCECAVRLGANKECGPASTRWPQVSMSTRDLLRCCCSMSDSCQPNPSEASQHHHDRLTASGLQADDHAHLLFKSLLGQVSARLDLKWES